MEDCAVALCDTLYCSPGNGGIGAVATLLPAMDAAVTLEFCQSNHIELVVIGPEAPLVAGLADRLRAENIAVFGPGAAAARLEGSKGFMKDLCREHGIATADYERFDSAEAAQRYLDTGEDRPLVVKADGLAAGKGVLMCRNRAEAKDAITQIFGGQFGEDAGAEVVIEAWLEGEEISLFAISDGRKAWLLGVAQDHKRAYDGDEGPNTGGMGAYSPAPCADNAMQLRIMDEIVQPTVDALAVAGTPFQGVLFAGIMLTENGPELLEYNVRFGDPECQCLMRLLDSDIVPLLLASAKGEGLDDAPLVLSQQHVMCVVMASEGYPGSYEKGTEITGTEALTTMDGVELFHAGTLQQDGKLLAIGGRVLNITATGDTLQQSRDRAYAAIEAIDWPKGFNRTDIGWRALG